MTMDGRVLLTGASGFIGSTLASRLLSDGADVSCLVRTVELEAAHKRGIPEDRMIKISSFQHAELAPIMDSLQPEYIFHLAASGVNPQDSDPEDVLNGNVNLVTQLLLSVRGCSVKRIIHTGSCSEYAISPSEDYLTEDSPIGPDTLYGAAKAASVIYGNALAKQLAVPFTTLRLFGVYGVGEAPGRLVPYLIDRLACDESVDLTPGEQIRDLLYIDDIVEAFLAAATSPEIESYRAYNVCSGCETQIKDMAIEVARAMDKPRRLLEFGGRPYRPDESMRIVGSNERFCRDTKWKPRISLQDGIRRMVENRKESSVSPFDDAQP